MLIRYKTLFDLMFHKCNANFIEIVMKEYIFFKLFKHSILINFYCTKNQKAGKKIVKILMLFFFSGRVGKQSHETFGRKD